MFRDGGPGDSVGHVGAGQELVAQVQQLDMQRHGLLPLEREEDAGRSEGGGGSSRSTGYSHRQVTQSHQFVIQVNSTNLKVTHEELCHTSGEKTSTHPVVSHRAREEKR